MKLLFLFGFVAFACASAIPKEAKDTKDDIEKKINEIDNMIRSHPRYRNTPDGPVPHSKPVIQTTSAPKTHDNHTIIHSSSNSQENSTTAQEHNTLKDEIVYLKEQYTKVRGEIDHWMDSPYHRTVILPALIGVSFGFLTILLHFLLKKCCRMCNKRCSRTYMGRRQRYNVADMKNLLDRKHESDDAM